MGSTRFGPLADAVQLDGELGRGAFGIVFAGRLLEGGRRVAVKLPLQAPDRAERARIEREVSLLAGIDHPRLARLLAAHEAEEGRLALVYERIEGRPLSQVLAEGVADRPEVVRWAEDLAEGLEELHRRGLVHRDLKPANVMREPSGRLRLLDYGLLRQATPGRTLTPTGVVLGTPHFLAPEQLSGERIGPAADVFALACLLYQALTGRLPVEGSPGEVLRARLDRSLPEPPPVPDLGPPGSQALRQALGHDPAQRPTPRGLAEAMAESLRSDASPGRPDRTAPAPGFPAGRRALHPGPGGAGAGTPGAEHQEAIAPGSPLRAPVWALVGLVLAAGFAWRRPGRGTAGTPEPGESATHPRPGGAERIPGIPAPPDPGGFQPDRLPEGVLDRLEAELTDAAGWRIAGNGEVVKDDRPRDGAALPAFLDPDPLEGGNRIGGLAALSEVASWLRRGGRLDLLGPGDQDHLRGIDDRLAEADLPRLFSVPLEAIAARGEEFELGPGDFPAMRFPGQAGQRVRGWQAVALRNLSQAALRLVAMGEQLQRDLPDRPPGGLAPGPVMLRAGRNPRDYLEFSWRLREHRIRLREWTQELRDRLHGFLWAGFRWVEEEGREPAWAAWVVADYLGGIRAGLVSDLADLDPVWILGGAPGGPREMVVAASLVGFQACLARSLGSEGADQARSRRALALAAAAEGIADGPGVAAMLVGLAFEIGLETAVEAGIDEPIPALARRMFARVSRIDKIKRVEIAQSLLAHWDRRRERSGLDPELLEWVAAELADGRGRRPGTVERLAALRAHGLPPSRAMR